MSKRLRYFFTGVTICLVLATIAACAPATPKTATTTTKATTTPATTTTTTSGKVVPKGSAIVAVSNLGTQPLDPQFLTGSPEYPLGFSLTCKANYYNPKTGLIEPWLLDSWVLEGDLVTWTCKVAKGVKFHSGNTLTAKDFEWSFNKIVKEQKAAPGVVSSTTTMFASLTAVDDYTFKLVTKTPYVLLMSQVAQSNAIYAQPFNPLDSKYGQSVGYDEFSKRPSLTGPYKFVDQVIGDYTKLEAFPDSYLHPAYTKNLTFKIIPEAATRLAVLKTGEADVITDVSGALIPQLKQVTGIKTVSAKEASLWEIIVSDYWYPDEKSPLLDKRVRQALAYAIDKQTIIDKVFFGEGAAQVIPSCAPWMVGADSSIKGYPYDMVKAKQLLKDAGYPDGFKYTLQSRPQHMDLAQAVAGYWKDLGITVDLKSIEAGVYLELATTKKLRGCWVTTVPTMPPDIGIRYSEYYLDPKAQWSWCNNPTLNKNMADALSTRDEVKRVEKMKAISQYVADELPSRIPTIAVNSVYGLGPKVDSIEVGRDSYWCYPQSLKMKE